jgi:hypothetical protein
VPAKPELHGGHARAPGKLLAVVRPVRRGGASSPAREAAPSLVRGPPRARVPEMGVRGRVREESGVDGRDARAARALLEVVRRVRAGRAFVPRSGGAGERGGGGRLNEEEPERAARRRRGGPLFPLREGGARSHHSTLAIWLLLHRSNTTVRHRREGVCRLRTAVAPDPPNLAPLPIDAHATASALSPPPA